MHLSSKIAVLLLALFCASANAADCSVTSTGDIPLYPSIFVPRTADEESAGLAAVNSIPPGPTVLLSIGMSNAKGIWDVFIDDADSDPLKDPDLEVVNGAQAGGAVESWAVALLGERRVRNAKVGGSILLDSTIHVPEFRPSDVGVCISP